VHLADQVHELARFDLVMPHVLPTMHAICSTTPPDAEPRSAICALLNHLSSAFFEIRLEISNHPRRNSINQRNWPTRIKPYWDGLESLTQKPTWL
jgi:hypothetical protein